MRSGLMLLAVLLPAALPAQQTADAVAQVDGLFAQWNDTTPGCAAAAARDGRTLLARAWGMADLENDVPNTAATIFEAGSVSKQFTAAAIVLLALDGKLHLTDDVRRYIPELPDYGTPITIRHLLTHTSGLRDWGSVAEIAGWGRSARTHTHAHVLDILSRQSALNFEPGAEYSYSNSGYNLLAMVVDRVSGMPFARFSEQRIFEPLGMNDTQWRDDYTRIVKRRSAAYRMRGGDYVIDRPIENVHGNGGLLTTVADLLAWNAALASGKLGGQRFVEMMHDQGLLNDGDRIEYAAGLFITSYRGVPEISHTGATSGYRAFLARYPEQRLDVALLCNSGTVNPGLVGHQIAEVLLGSALQPITARAPAAPPQRSATPPVPTDLMQFAGVYHSPDAESSLTVSVRDGRLILGRRPATTLVLTPRGGDEFSAGTLGRVRFIRDDTGRIRQLSVQQARVYDLRFDRVQ